MSSTTWNVLLTMLNFQRISEELIEEDYIFSNAATADLKEMSDKVIHMYDLTVDTSNDDRKDSMNYLFVSILSIR